MITLEFEFQTGRYHATKWGTSPNEGKIDWPPAPWRILRSIIHAWKTYHDDIDHDTMWPVLKGMCSHDALFCLPTATQSHTRHYMPIVSNDGKSVTKTEKVIDAFLVLDGPLYVMWDAQLDEGQKAALGAVVADIRYLGRAESWCNAQVTDEVRTPNCAPLAGGPIGGDYEIADVMAPSSDATLDDLCARTQTMHKEKKLYPDNSRIVKYARLANGHRVARPKSRDRGVEVVRYRIGGRIRPKITEAVVVCDAFKRAAMSKYKESSGDCESSTLSGKAADGKTMKGNHAHAFFLATAEGESAMLDHITVFSKTPFTREEIDALASVRLVWNKDRMFKPVYVGRGNRGSFASPPQILESARKWVSVTPYVPNRHPKVRGKGADKRLVDGPEEQIVRELQNREFPSVSSVEVHGPREKISGFLPAEFKRWRKAGLPGFGAYSVAIEFESDVQGPMSLGHSSHYGLGLFKPATGQDAKPRGRSGGEPT